jgi:membrane associated rhomboid family serine protease
VIPFRDYNPTSRFPVVTVLLIAANVVVFLLVGRSYNDGGLDQQVTYEYAAIPCEIVTGRPLTEVEGAQTARGDLEACDTTSPRGEVPMVPGKPVYVAILFSMFLHADLLHLLGNLLFLWIFGNNIEDRMGHVVYLGFYLLSGVAATAAHVLVQPASTVPIVGASGAIAGVMGAYIVLFPNVPIRALIFFVIADVPTKWLLGFWFVMQFFTNRSSGVAWVAHVAGFLFGVVVAYAFRDRLRPRSLPQGFAW